MAKNRLTPKQRKFVGEYLKDLNATQAAIRANYSRNNADKIGPELLGKTCVAEAIQKAMGARSKRTEITADRVVLELARVGFGDLRDVATWGPNGVKLKNSLEISDDAAVTISEVSETVTKDGGTTRIKRHDKMKALELLAKHLGMLKESSAPNGEQGRSILSSILEALKG